MMNKIYRPAKNLSRSQLRNDTGDQILATLSQELIAEFDRGFDATNLTRMMKFAEAFPDEEIVASCRSN